MMVAKFKEGTVTHRIESAVMGSARAFCGESGEMDLSVDTDVIFCPKCREIHMKLCAERLQSP